MNEDMLAHSRVPKVKLVNFTGNLNNNRIRLVLMSLLLHALRISLVMTHLARNPLVLSPPLGMRTST